MKKMISVILSIAIIMSMFTFAVSATDDAQTAPAITPLFEMEISNTGEGFTITDGVANSLVDTSRGVDYTAFDDTQAATYGEHEVSGIKTPYLTFAKGDETANAYADYANTKSAIRIPLTEDIAKKDALTFETWARFDEKFGTLAQWSGIAAIGQTGFNAEAGAAFALRTDCDAANKGSGMIRVYPNLGEVRNLWNTYTTTYPNGEIKDDLYYDPNGDYITEEMKEYWTDYGYLTPIRIGGLYNNARTDSSALATESYANKWSHIVVTREWSEDDTDGVGRYITNIYVNGVSVGSSTSPASDKKGYSKSTEEFKDIIIGSAANSGASFTGDIAAFNVYEGVMDSTQVLSSFLANADKFYEGFTYDAEKIFDLKINKGEAEGEYTVADANGQYGMVNGTIDTTVINNGPEPVYGEATVGSNTIPYLSFAHTPTVNGTTYTYQGENSGVRVPLKVNLAQKEAITLETWVRFDQYVALNNRYNSIFGVNTSAAPSLANKAFDLRVGSTYLEAYGASDMVTDIYTSAETVDDVNKYGYTLTSLGNNSNALHNATTQKYALSNSAYANKWSHIVLTRVWNDSNSDGLGTWTVTVYLDSVPVSTKTYPTAGEVSKTSKEYNNLIIGKSSDTSFAGDIATFTVYDKAMDAEDVVEKYTTDASKYVANFYYDADKVFDMDIVAGETTGGITSYIVKDKNTFKSATVMDIYSAMNGGGAYADNGVYTTDKPIYFNENGIEYLRFAHRDSEDVFKNTNAQINVKLNNKDFVDSDEMSFETWIRNNHMTNSSWNAYKTDGTTTGAWLGRRTLFALGDHPGHAVMSPGSGEAFNVTFDVISGISYESGGLSLYNDLAKSTTGTLLANVSPYEAEWTHYVITRKWTPANNNEPFGAGTWSSTTYINGKDAGTTTQTVDSRTEYKDLCNADWAVNSGVGNADYLAIGGNLDVNGHKAFAGDISKFAVYNKVLAEAEVASKYVATKDTYQPNVAHVSISPAAPDTVTANTVVIQGTSFLARTTKIDVDATFNNYNSSKALLPVVAAYDSEGYLLGLNVLAVAADNTFGDMANLTGVFDVEEYRADIETIRVLVWDGATLEPYYNAPDLVKVP